MRASCGEPLRGIALQQTPDGLGCLDLGSPHNGCSWQTHSNGHLREWGPSAPSGDRQGLRRRLIQPADRGTAEGSEPGPRGREVGAEHSWRGPRQRSRGTQPRQRACSRGGGGLPLECCRARRRPACTSWAPHALWPTLQRARWRWWRRRRQRACDSRADARWRAERKGGPLRLHRRRLHASDPPSAGEPTRSAATSRALRGLEAPGGQSRSRGGHGHLARRLLGGTVARDRLAAPSALPTRWGGGRRFELTPERVRCFRRHTVLEASRRLASAAARAAASRGVLLELLEARGG